MRRRTGSSLAEVLVAVVILEVGLLGVAGMVVTASRTLARAETVAGAVALAREVSDSLAAVGEIVPGTARREGLEAAWAGRTDGVLQLRVLGGSGEIVLTLVQRPPRDR